MSERNYFVIRCNRDGDVSVTQLTKEEILDRVLNIADPYFGTTKCMSRLESRDPQCWGDELLVIKGEIVTPIEKTKVVEYDLP